MKEANQSRLSTFLIVFMLTCAAVLPFSSAAMAKIAEVPAPLGDGPYQVGWLDTDVPKTSTGTVPVAVYYPSIVYGIDIDPNLTDAPYPALFFSPGFETTLDNYRAIAARIASWGFVFTVVGSAPVAWDTERISDLNDTMNWLQEQNSNFSFALSQVADESRFGVMGHSLGGDAAIALSLSDARVKVLVPVAAFISYPMTVASTESSMNIHVPTYSVVGSEDTVSPPDSMGYPFYDHGNAPKFCVTLVGDNHISVAFSCISYVVSFLKLSLEGNQEYARYVYGTDAQQEVLSGSISLRYDLKKTVNYSIVYNGTTYNVSVYSDSTFLTFLYNETMRKMDFTLTGAPFTSGSANVSIPTQLVGAYNVTVYFDEEAYPIVLMNDPEFYHVYLVYNNSLHSLDIEFIDLTPPFISIVSPVADFLTNLPNVTVMWEGGDAASGLDNFEVKMDEEPWINVGNASSCILGGLTDGDHEAYVQAFDKAGNNRTVYVRFKVDTTSPTVSIISPTSGSIVDSANVTVSWNASDVGSGIDYCEARLDQGQWMNLGLDTSDFFVGLSDGNHTVQIRAVDKAGNPFETQVDFTVRTNPTGSLPLTQWLLIGAAGVIIVSFAVAIGLRRRKTRSSN